jgi:hypothetical protein
LTVKIPWNDLKNESVIVDIDGVFARVTTEYSQEDVEQAQKRRNIQKMDYLERSELYQFSKFGILTQGNYRIHS